MEHKLLDFAINIITHPAFNVVSGLAGFYFGNKFIIGRDKTNRFNSAADEFHSAFVEELAMLDKTGPLTAIRDPFEILEAAAPKHKKAVRAFSRFLTTNETAALDRAWKNYYRHHQYPEKEIVCLEQYSTAGHGREENEKRFKLAFERLSAVAAFAEHK